MSVATPFGTDNLAIYGTTEPSIPQVLSLYDQACDLKEGTDYRVLSGSQVLFKKGARVGKVLKHFRSDCYAIIYARKIGAGIVSVRTRRQGRACHLPPQYVFYTKINSTELFDGSCKKLDEVVGDERAPTGWDTIVVEPNTNEEDEPLSVLADKIKATRK